MKLLFLYGAPAVGKLSVAEEIAKRTGFKVFHNHLSIDCIVPIFESGSPSFFKLVELIGVETVAEAARADQDLITTFCYAKGLDEPHVEQIIQAVEKNGGEVCFVLLIADKIELEKRVLEASRQKYGKAKTVEKMRYFFDNYELFSPVPGRESLHIDNTHISVEMTAQRIIEHFDLARQTVGTD